MLDDRTIRVEGVSAIVDGQFVLRDVHAEFPAGKVTLLLGSNGCGKTMLLELMAGLRKPAAGQVYVGTEALWPGNKPNRRLLCAIGLSMQQPEDMLFARTIREEFHYSLKPVRMPEQRRVRAAERALARWLHGATGDGWLDRDPLALSGGQRRRLAMALTDAAEPDWLLLDEPTAGLDRQVLAGFRRRLAERRQSGKGTVVVTHDPELLIHEADHVVLMREGRHVWSGTPDRLAARPELFAEAGMALPEELQLAERLRAAGFQLPGGWPEAEALAAALAAQTANEAAKAAVRELDAAGGAVGQPTDADNRPAPTPDAGPAKPAAAVAARVPPMAAFDPRALWFCCLALTAGIGMQTTWPGWLAGAAVSVLCIRLSGLPASAWLRPAKALVLFALITSLAAGFQPGEAVWFDTEAALATFRRFSKLVMMALLGFTLMAGISPMRLKLALERALSPFARFLPVRKLALASSLTLRFMPLLLASWDRFARIAASRGKRPVKPGSVPLSLIAMTVVPFLLALIRLGDTLSAMLIVRGVGRAEDHPARRPATGVSPAFTRRDFWLCGGTALVLALLLVIKKTV